MEKRLIGEYYNEVYEVIPSIVDPSLDINTGVKSINEDSHFCAMLENTYAIEWIFKNSGIYAPVALNRFNSLSKIIDHLRTGQLYLARNVAKENNIILKFSKKQWTLQLLNFNYAETDVAKSATTDIENVRIEITIPASIIPLNKHEKIYLYISIFDKSDNMDVFKSLYYHLE